MSVRIAAYHDSKSAHYEMEDLLEQANEIQESLGRSYSVPDEIDEADLEAGKSCSTLTFCVYQPYPQNWMPSLWKKRRRLHT